MDSAATVTEPPKPELTLVFGNESNPVDGVLGPVTYGLAGVLPLPARFSLEGDFVRMHEPQTPTFHSFLDEGEIALHLPALATGPTSVVVTPVYWVNRTVEMYTDLAGLETSWDFGSFSVTLGGYYGTGEQGDLSDRFVGYQVGVGTTVGRTELALSHVSGAMRPPGETGLGTGTYQHTALESTTDLSNALHTPLSLTLAVEARYFSFGQGLLTSEPADTFIFVVGAELNLTELFGG